MVFQMKGVCVCRKKMEVIDETIRLLVWKVKKKSRMTCRFLPGIAL